jgi:hypothetical protein
VKLCSRRLDLGSLERNLGSGREIIRERYCEFECEWRKRAERAGGGRPENLEGLLDGASGEEGPTGGRVDRLAAPGPRPRNSRTREGKSNRLTV